MALKDTLLNFGAGLILERPVQQSSLSELESKLQSSGDRIAQRLANTADTAENRKILSHIIGIERWGQRRLRVILSERFVFDEYDTYRPGRELTWSELKIQFSSTRSQTLELINCLKHIPSVDELQVRHNQFGSISTKAWLRYLDVHANGELRKLVMRARS